MIAIIYLLVGIFFCLTFLKDVRRTNELTVGSTIMGLLMIALWPIILILGIF